MHKTNSNINLIIYKRDTKHFLIGHKIQKYYKVEKRVSKKLVSLQEKQ